MITLPLKLDIETKVILKASIEANKALANLNGASRVIPNQYILINALTLQEAKDSSEIENIITTYDRLYTAILNTKSIDVATKEVQNYKDALLFGYEKVKENKIIKLSDIKDIQKILVNNNAGFRKQSGTVLKNQANGEVIYTPPQEYDEILKYLNNLLEYINDDSLEDYDFLVKLAIIHYQFESIHPFYDGNGRTGRILNILYLVLKDLLDLPILYLSGYIIKNKLTYYKLFEEVRKNGNWQEWLLFFLNGIKETSNETIDLVNSINNLMQKQKEILKSNVPKIYSKDLLESLFLHPYTKIDFLIQRLGVTRQTASKYLKEIEKTGILELENKGKERFYINKDLYSLFRKS